MLLCILLVWKYKNITKSSQLVWKTWWFSTFLSQEPPLFCWDQMLALDKNKNSMIYYMHHKKSGEVKTLFWRRKTKDQKNAIFLYLITDLTSFMSLFPPLEQLWSSVVLLDGSSRLFWKFHVGQSIKNNTFTSHFREHFLATVTSLITN